MRTKKRILRVGFIIVLAIAAIFLLASQTTTASEKTYKINAGQHSVRGYTSEVDRVMVSYEKLMNRYMDMVDSNMRGISYDTKKILGDLSSIDKKINTLDERIARIEKALKIEPPEKTKKRKTSR
jgi:hypothetical protein